MKSVDIPKEERRYMSDLHHDNMEWKNILNFYKEELIIMTHRLEDVVSRNTGKTMLRNAEHYQNVFVMNREKVDELLHEIKMEEHELSGFAKSHPVAIEHTYFRNHVDLEQKMEYLMDSMMELREEFKRYLIKWI